MRHLILQVREGLLNWRKGCVQELFVLSAINTLQWIAHGWKKIPCSFISGYAGFVGEIINYQYEIPTYYYYLFLLNTKSIWLSHTCCTKANPDLNPLFEMLQSIQRLGIEPSEKMLTVMRIKLSTLSSSFMSCQRSRDFSRPPQPPTLTNNIPWKPSLYHRAEQLLESLPATCVAEIAISKNTTRWLSQTGISKFVSRKSVRLRRFVAFLEMLHLWKNLGCSTFEIRCVEKLWVYATLFSTSMTTWQPCQELLGDTSTSDASQP